MLAVWKMGGHGTSFMIKSFLIQSRLATFHNSSSGGRTSRAGVRLFGSGGLPSAHKYRKYFTKPTTKWTIGGGTIHFPSGIQSIAPMHRQQVWGRLNAPVSVTLGTIYDDHRAKIEPPNCWKYKPGNFLAVTPLNWDQISDEDDDDDNGADPGVPSSGWSRPGDGNDNDDGESKEDTQGSEKGTGKGKGTDHGKGKGKAPDDGKGEGRGKGKGNGKGTGIVIHTPEGDDISRAVALQLQKHLSQADLDTEG